MTERSLSNLYRRMSSSTPVTDWLDAEQLVDACAGTLKGDRRDEVAARLANSPAQTDLVRLLRDLQPASESLVDALSARSGLAHARRGRANRSETARPARRVLRWSALAASLVFAVTALVWRGAHPPSTQDAMTADLPDRIFVGEDQIFAMTDDSLPTAHSDALFRTDFSGG